jgi:hypothetical protein
VLRGAPFGTTILEALFHGIALDIYFPVKILIAAASFLACWFILRESQAIMDGREWRIEREYRRTKHE